MSRVFCGGNGPIHWRTTCAQAYAGAIFCGRVLTRAFAGSLLSRNAFANALVFNFLKRELPHLPLHWHLFLPLHGHIFPFNGHIFPFMATYSPSSAHLPLHWHLFAFIGTSSPSWVHLRFKDTWRGGGWRDMVCFRESFREAFAGIREGPGAKNAQSIPIRFMPHLHALNLRGETSKTDPRFAYADCLREDYREASARCLRVPTRTCKYQCFRFRGVNSSPHKKVPSFQKKRGSNGCLGFQV